MLLKEKFQNEFIYFVTKINKIKINSICLTVYLNNTVDLLCISHSGIHLRRKKKRQKKKHLYINRHQTLFNEYVRQIVPEC